MCFRKVELQSSEHVYTGVFDHIHKCRIVKMLGCTIHPSSFCFFIFQTFNIYTQFCFSILFSTLTHEHRHTHALTHAHTPTRFLAVQHGGLSCCLSNQCMSSFQLHWSEHIIPFPTAQHTNTCLKRCLLHTQTLAYTHTLSLSPSTVLPTHSPGETLLPTVNPKDLCVSLNKMRLCVITRHYTTEPLSN